MPAFLLALASDDSKPKMSSKSRTRWLMYSMGALVCLSAGTSALSNAGLCFSERRFLSDRDFIKGAVDVVIQDPVDGVTEYESGRSVSKLVKSQKYASADEFLEENPDCCKFVPANSGDGGAEASLLDRIAGVRTIYVSYVKRYADDAGIQKSSRVGGNVAVTSCGQGRPYR